MKRQKALSLLQLLIGVVITLVIAGIVAPSLLRSDLAKNEALAAGSLHTINIAGVVPPTTTKNFYFALWGGVGGAMAFFPLLFPATTPENTTSTRATALRAAPL